MQINAALQHAIETVFGLSKTKKVPHRCSKPPRLSPMLENNSLPNDGHTSKNAKEDNWSSSGLK